MFISLILVVYELIEYWSCLLYVYIESQAQFQAYNEDVLEIEDELPFEFSNEQEEFEDDEEFDDEK